MIKAVIFDMDGVIIDSEPLYFKVCNEYLEAYGVKITKDEYLSYIGKPAHEIWISIKEKYKISKAIEELITENRKCYIEYIINDTTERPIQGVDRLIKDLYENHIKMALASSSSQEIISIILNKFDLKKYFDVIVSGDDIKEGKSSPKIFLHTAERLGIKPSMCLVIEDSCSGVKSAKEAGMICAALKNPALGNQDIEGCDFVIKNFSNISFEDLSEICKKP
jgi:HAD superfamily hydrolase (TIGR01549 family)